MKGWLWVALAVATQIKLYFALYTEGSLDVAGFRDHLDKIRELGIGAYYVRGRFGNPFNSPPPMIYVIQFWGWLADLTGIPFGFWLRLFPTLADIGSFFLVAHWLKKLKRNKDHFWVLLVLALCPASILISGFHGNTDSLLIFLLLLTISVTQNRLCGMIFGLALCVKVQPLMFAPVILLYLPDWKRRFTFFVLAAFTFIVCSLPYIAQEPMVIWRSVFAYGSSYGVVRFIYRCSKQGPSPAPHLLHDYRIIYSSRLFLR